MRRGEVKRRTLVGLWCALACAALLVTSCGRAGEGEKTTVAGATPSNATGATPRPERIISLSPSATEILYGVGAFERVVAVSGYCD